MSPADLRAARLTLGLREGLDRAITQKELARRLRMGTHGWQSISAWESDNNDRGVPGPVQVAVLAMLEGEGFDLRSIGHALLMQEGAAEIERLRLILKLVEAWAGRLPDDTVVQMPRSLWEQVCEIVKPSSPTRSLIE